MRFQFHTNVITSSIARDISVFPALRVIQVVHTLQPLEKGGGHTCEPVPSWENVIAIDESYDLTPCPLYTYSFTCLTRFQGILVYIVCVISRPLHYMLVLFYSSVFLAIFFMTHHCR